MHRSTFATLGMILLAMSVALIGNGSAMAQNGAAFGTGKPVAGKANEYAASPYAITYQDTLYTYATGKDGNGYYATYDDSQWSEWQGWDQQPAKYQGQPKAV